MTYISWAISLHHCSRAEAGDNGFLLSKWHPALWAGCWVGVVASGFLSLCLLNKNHHPTIELEQEQIMVPVRLVYCIWGTASTVRVGLSRGGAFQIIQLLLPEYSFYTLSWRDKTCSWLATPRKSHSFYTVSLRGTTCVLGGTQPGLEFSHSKLG